MATGLIQMTPYEYGTITLDSNILTQYGNMYYYRYGNLLVLHLCFNVVAARSHGNPCIGASSMPSFTYEPQTNFAVMAHTGDIYAFNLGSNGLISAESSIPAGLKFDITWPMIVTK